MPHLEGLVPGLVAEAGAQDEHHQADVEEGHHQQAQLFD